MFKRMFLLWLFVSVLLSVNLYAVVDSFYVTVDMTGQVIYGGGSGYNGGTWYYYPETEWWNEWFSNEPFVLNNMKTIHTEFTVQPLDPGLPSYVEIAYNWSTVDWWATGIPEPPLPGLFDPLLEDRYIQRHIFYVNGNLFLPEIVIDDFEIKDYNPAWVSIDVRGYNFQISGVTGLDAQIRHDCVPNKTKNMKWSQPPIEIDPAAPTVIYCGEDELSIKEPITAEPIWITAADDYRCLGDMPVTSVHWWGSFIGYQDDVLPPGIPLKWRIGFWSNMPAGASGVPYSHPDMLLHEVYIDNPRVEYEFVGFDAFPTPDGQLPIVDSCWQFYVRLSPEEYFWQGEFNSLDNVYWVSITAIYEDGLEVPFPWGWKSRPWHWMDDGVKFTIFEDYGPGYILSPSQVTPIEKTLDNEIWESYDLAFELDTDPEWVKWEQSFCGIRQWPHYEDELSMAIETASGDLDVISKVADDWPCTRRTPITAIAWWGSYIGFTYEACRQPVYRPYSPDYFLIEIWTDIPDPDPTNPDTYSRPGQKIWEYRADRSQYDEVLVGFDKHPEFTGPIRHEPVFRYNVRLPEDAWFCQIEENGVYWISVMAVYRDFQPSYPWGWTNHTHLYNDDAVAGVFDGINWQWRELFDQTGTSEDMSFMLFTNPDVTCDCLNDNLANLAEWVQFGKPQCWCYERNCRGDANGKPEGTTKTGIKYVYLADLALLTLSYNVAEPPKGPGIMSIPNGICADFNRDPEGTTKTGIKRVYLNDLGILTINYNVAEPPNGPGVPLCPLYTAGGEINYYVYPP